VAWRISPEIHLGDVINAVDGKSVKSPAELQAELAGKTVGDKVRLGFLIRGQWQTETVVLWPK
jgi:S1-C subfamily serine protease